MGEEEFHIHCAQEAGPDHGVNYSTLYPSTKFGGIFSIDIFDT